MRKILVPFAATHPLANPIGEANVQEELLVAATCRSLFRSHVRQTERLCRRGQVHDCHL